MSESNAYQMFKANVVQPGDRIDRIENLLGSGTPDVNFCSGGFECWIEIKSPKEPRRAATPLFGSNHRISQEQMNWALRQRRAGGRCYFLISTNKRWMLISGGLADYINNWTIAECLDNATWSTSKPVRDKDQWQFLREALRR